jgi:copper chaperone CopZ
MTIGCSGAVDRALKKVAGIKLAESSLTVGISSVDISLKDQLVKVDATSATFEDVENAIKKTGKKINAGKIVSSAGSEEKSVESSTPVVA